MANRRMQMDGDRPFFELEGGGRSYVSPVAMGTGEKPGDNFFRTTHWDQDAGKWERDTNWGNIGALATGAYLGSVALPAVLSGAPSAAQAASTGAIDSMPGAATQAGNIGALSAPGAPTAAGAGGGKGMLGSLGKLFGKGGLDPTMLLLSGLSMFGGGEGRQSFAGKGTADPVAMLQAALARNEAMGQSAQQKGPARLRSSMVSAPPQPVNLPGLGMQIGGGLGVDPALMDPSLLEGRGLDQMTNAPYPQRTAPRQAQRRNPSNG